MYKSITVRKHSRNYRQAVKKQPFIWRNTTNTLSDNLFETSVNTQGFVWKFSMRYI